MEGQSIQISQISAGFVLKRDLKEITVSSGCSLQSFGALNQMLYTFSLYWNWNGCGQNLEGLLTSLKRKDPSLEVMSFRGMRRLLPSI